MLTILNKVGFPLIFLNGDFWAKDKSQQKKSRRKQEMKRNWKVNIIENRGICVTCAKGKCKSIWCLDLVDFIIITKWINNTFGNIRLRIRV